MKPRDPALFAAGMLTACWLFACIGHGVQAQVQQTQDVNVRVPDTTEMRQPAGLSAAETEQWRLFRRFAEMRETELANEIIAQADGKKSQVIAGSILAGAIAYAIKAIVTALIYTLIVTVLIALFWKYAVWIGLAWFVTVLLPAWFAGSWAGRRAAK